MRSNTSRGRINDILRFKATDRIGVYDEFTDGALGSWRKNGFLAKDECAGSHFDMDIRLFGFSQDFAPAKKNAPTTLALLDSPSAGECITTSYEAARKSDKFLALSFMEPFEQVSRAVGRERLLLMMAEEANNAADALAGSMEASLTMCQLILDNGYKFDGVWLFGDIGYRKSLFFSTDYYNAFLFELHREICEFFSGCDMPVIFHSDGNIEEIIPHLIEAGVRGMEPFESDVGMDLRRIKTEYGRDIVICGGIDERTYTDKKTADKEIASKLELLMKAGGYIYRADSPIDETITYENYKAALGCVRRYGVY